MDWKFTPDTQIGKEGASLLLKTPDLAATHEHALAEYVAPFLAGVRESLAGSQQIERYKRIAADTAAAQAAATQAEQRIAELKTARQQIERDAPAGIIANLRAVDADINAARSTIEEHEALKIMLAGARTVAQRELSVALAQAGRQRAGELMAQVNDAMPALLAAPNLGGAGLLRLEDLS
jgi:hypothetical protein